MPRRRRQPNNAAAPAHNLRRRGPQLEEQPPHRRQRNDNVEVQQELNMPNQDNDVQVLAPVPQPIGEVDDHIRFDEPNMLPNINETDIFISQTVKEKFWQFHYIDLSIMHKSNFCSHFDKQCYLGLNKDGRLITQTNLLKKKTIINIETWTDAFLAYSQVLIQRHLMKASQLFAYIAIIRGAAADSTIEKWYMYDQQFRLRVSRNPTKNLNIIDAQLWLQIMAIASSNTQQPRNNKCYDFNFKGVCSRNSCRFSHTYLKCSLNHPSSKILVITLPQNSLLSNFSLNFR
ncbi:unnamed protein product [Mytilus coruscus]|uniref:C3H1-type domain-containing protein n=1 Tax=Mytilus coruscus TaxID=42192 RepID=A0A6J8DBY1_MYTCO|nr:unnamed protein product [Mytilus coruscus]